MTSPPDSSYQCGVCGEVYVVPSLARDCEERHGHPQRACDVPALIVKRIA